MPPKMDALVKCHPKRMFSWNNLSHILGQNLESYFTECPLEPMYIDPLSFETGFTARLSVYPQKVFLF